MCCGALAAPVTTLPIRSMYVLGDSLSDQGNLLAATTALGAPSNQPGAGGADGLGDIGEAGAPGVPTARAGTFPELFIDDAAISLKRVTRSGRILARH